MNLMFWRKPASVDELGNLAELLGKLSAEPVPSTLATAGRKLKLFTIIQRIDHPSVDVVWEHLQHIAAAGYTPSCVFFGRCDERRIEALANTFDDVYGGGEFARRVRFSPITRRTSETPTWGSISARGAFAWVGGSIRLGADSSHAVSGSDLGSIELSFATFGNYFRRGNHAFG